MNKYSSNFSQNMNRRSLLNAGLAALAVNGPRLLGVPLALGQAAQAVAADVLAKDRILVVVELSRRAFLSQSAKVAGAAFLAGCGWPRI